MLFGKICFSLFWFLVKGANQPWFFEEEAQLAAQERDALLKELTGWVQYGTKSCKLYTFSVSSGRAACQDGYWG